MAASFIFRSSLKLGIVGGATYATIYEGFWGNSQQSREAYEKLLRTIPNPSPYLDRLKININIEDYMKHSLKEYWNSGVRYTFCGLSMLPSKTAEYTNLAWNKIYKMISDST